MFLDDEVTCEKKEYFRQESSLTELTAEMFEQKYGYIASVWPLLISFGIRLTQSSTGDFREWHSIKGNTRPICIQLYVFTSY